MVIVASVSLSRWYGLKRLVFDTLDQTTSFVEKTHIGVADRTLRRLDLIPEVGQAARAVESIHRVGARLVYATIRGVGRGIDVVTEVPFEAALAREGLRADEAPGVPLDSDAMGTAPWVADTAQATLLGFFGDRLEQRGNTLVTGMALHDEGRPLAAHREALAAAFPEASDRIVVLVHGLACTEWSWSYRARESWGDPRMHYGAALARDLGMTPVFVRYNTGRHISENGAALAELMSEVVAAWPVPVREVVLLGHSMGGLVSRSAAHQGNEGGAPWIPLLKRVISVGSPHLGAPLEKGVNVLTSVLKMIDSAGAQVPAELLDLRSAGVKDLRYGYILEEEWKDRDPDALLEDNRREVPFVESAQYAFIASTLTRDPAHPIGSLLGDILVRIPSASGQHPEPARRIPFHVGSVHGGLSHLTLANHPDVYEVLRRICSGEAVALPPPTRAHQTRESTEGGMGTRVLLASTQTMWTTPWTSSFSPR